MSKKIKKINSGIGDLRLLATFAFLMGIIFLILNLWNGIQISVDTYVEYKNNNIVEYTKNFIETERDEDIYRRCRVY